MSWWFRLVLSRCWTSCGTPPGMTYGDTRTPHDAEFLKAFANPTDSNGFIKNVTGLPLAHHPGAQWHYGISHDVLGVVVERVSGKPLQVFLEERIFRPLKMVDSAFVVAPSERHRIAEPFAVDPDSKKPITLVDPRIMSLMAAGGGSSQVGNGMVSTARDYLRFIQMLANGGHLEGVRILSRKSVELIGADHIRGLKGPIDGHGWGLGVTVRNDLGGVNQHGSVGDYWWGGFGGTSFIIDPTEQLVAVRMSQAPASRGYYNRAFRNFVYSALE
jgi:CubicO group peptidase (beta-lactamase class C family)